MSSTTDSKVVRNVPSTGTAPANEKDTQKPAVTLEEDDEFEDFPIDDWPASEQEVPPGREGETSVTHLWEESWDDDDTSEEFSKQLKAELEKVKATK